ncbi:hypothetical protein MGYG_07814 [Nannizzia gypsea CBS 118893]|uniref:Uncharacterized protein n=1 Tax=Arthroderma gypseum (strain ATCC MYA-4604 / CBS 118893) TaxID=535722 RepID=E4V483_ARTGP|nr:hypothetical protein MGYG_07814 [Nannizzia gypsea CBS 118893]EFR04807.1 hypothetical protein MGYG_07814 [Nannizzia gypsea CBS 118893]
MSGEDRPSAPRTSIPVPPVLQAGALVGTCGLLYGGVSGVLRAHHPIIKSISTGVYWFAFGSSFWWLRSNILRIQFEDNATAKERIYSSVASSGISGGAINWAMNRRFLPGLVICSMLGFVGQYSYNTLEKRQARLQSEPASTKTWAERMADSRWVPIRNLSDEQYKAMLQEKLLGVDVEIALIDDRLKELRGSGDEKSDTGK